MNDIFKAARDNLDIQQVYLAKGAINTSKEFSPTSFDHLLYESQHFVIVDAIKVSEIENVSEDNGTDSCISYIYEYFIDTGVRLVPKGTVNSVEDSDVLVEIEATFRNVYHCKIELEEESLYEFGKQNALYHTWPYWREYIHATCARLGVNPALTIGKFLTNPSKK